MMHVRIILAGASFAGAICTVGTFLYFFLTMRKLCVAGGASWIVLGTAAAAAALSSGLLLLITARSSRWSVTAYKVALWSSLILTLLVAAAAAATIGSVLTGPPATKGHSWQAVATCLGRQRFCSDHSAPSACCSEPAGCDEIETATTDCLGWRPAVNRLCYGCYRCRLAVRGMARGSMVPMVVLQLSVLLLGASVVHVATELTGNYPLPPRPVTGSTN